MSADSLLLLCLAAVALMLLRHIHRRGLPVVPGGGRTVTALLGALISTTVCQAGSTDVVPVRQHVLQLRVVDRSGFPVSGVRVHPRTLAGNTAEVLWDPQRHGEPRADVTDAEGTVQIAYPRFVDERQRTRGVGCSVEHPSWVAKRFMIPLDDEDPRVMLERGRRLAVSEVTSETGDTVTQNVFPLLSGHGLRDVWKRYSGGRLLSETVPFRRSRLRVVWLPDHGPVQFSGLIQPSDYGNGARILIRKLKLAPGTRLTGRLSDDVPRPVMNGYVMATASHHAGKRNRDRWLEWEEWVRIEPDGTFEFPSLPRDGFVQLFAGCDGWFSAQPSSSDLEKAGLAEYRGQLGIDGPRWPHVYRLGKQERVCEIAMQQTARYLVRAVTADGTPVSGIRIVCEPQQQLFAGRMLFPQGGFSHSRFLRLPADDRRRLAGLDDRSELAAAGVLMPRWNEFEKTTDAAGYAALTQLPGGSVERPARLKLRISHEGWRLAGRAGFSSKTIEPVGGQALEHTLELVSEDVGDPE